MAFTLTPALAGDFVGRKEITLEIVNQLSSKTRLDTHFQGFEGLERPVF